MGDNVSQPDLDGTVSNNPRDGYAERLPLDKDPESWARVSVNSVMRGSYEQAKNVLRMALHDIAALAQMLASRDVALRETTAEIERLAAIPDGSRNLFVAGEFTSHSGLSLPFKIDCDSLEVEDLVTLAAYVARYCVRFRSVHGIPRGGNRFADALGSYGTGSALDPVLIVDDVLTTGASMEAARQRLGPQTVGVVIFARGPCPDWIVPLFSMGTAPAENGWQLIETAPKSTSTLTTHGYDVRGQYILAFCPDESVIDVMGCICVVWWEPFIENGVWMGEAGAPVRPTHWRPLPAPPTPRDGDKP